MTFDSLVCFQTVVELGGFRLASEKLNKAQSAVSYSIKQLEDEIGFPLIDRSKYRSNLTSEGKAFFEKVKILIQNWHELQDYTSGLKKGCEPKIRIAISALLPLSPIMKGLKELKWRYPNTEVELIMDILGADRMLQKNEADLAISDVEGKLNKVESLKIGSLEMLPVGQIKSEKKLPQIVVGSSNIAQDRSAGIINKNSLWRVSDFNTKKELLTHGLGWGYMPKHLIEKELRETNLEKLSYDKNIVEIYLLRNKEKKMGPSLKLLWDFYSQLKTRPWIS
jgi:DNA-binding transcriptional LysR family regulator